MPNQLVTGVPGAGKTLYALARLVRPLVGATVELEGGEAVKRRVCVAGVRDLVLDHEVITATEFDQERGKIKVRGEWIEPDTEPRSPGDPPHDCERRSDNWWRWCMPGDLIVIDECQKLFRPMASGRRLPLFITMLETHRHFGVDFVFITQHPNLLHANVRNLVNLHNHVRRVLGGHTTIVYEWDHCHNPNSIKDAAAKMWRHDKSAYGLYKSAEVHTKLKHRVPLPVYVLLVAVVAVPGALYAAKERVFRGRAPVAQVAPAGAARVAGVASAAVLPAVAQVRPPGFIDVPELSGCWAVGDDCKCMDRNSRLVRVALPMCKASARSYEGLVPWAPRPVADGKGYGAAAAVAPSSAASTPSI